MKIRDSGMPEQAQWEAYFDPESVLRRLKFPDRGDAADFGCGYGTFVLAAARLTPGTIHAFDIEAGMIAATASRARKAGLANVQAVCCDFMGQRTHLDADSVNYAMLFNVLHAEQPARLLAEAFRVLKPGGRLGMMHWVHDARTPRGPALNIRPKPEQCRQWAAEAGFVVEGDAEPLPPHHFGLVARKPVQRFVMRT